jgi:predicted ATPase
MLANVRVLDESLKTRIGKTSIEFKPGINLIVGSNGCGKSSLIDAIQDEYLNGKGISIRLTRDNNVPITFYSAEQATKSLSNNSRGTLVARQKSYGQSLADFLSGIKMLRGEQIIILDEPETALDFQNVKGLATDLMEIIKTGQIQVIIASHSPIFLLMPNINIVNMDREDPDYDKAILRFMRLRLDKMPKERFAAK